MIPFTVGYFANVDTNLLMLLRVIQLLQSQRYHENKRKVLQQSMRLNIVFLTLLWCSRVMMIKSSWCECLKL